jgi:2-hydroxychromene-2-carboxylate isomerase
VSKRLSFFFDYSSPFAYLGATQVQRVCEEHGAELEWCPFLLGGLFRAIGTPMVPLHAMPQAKQDYQLIDMQRWATHWGVRFRFPSRFPMNTVKPLRMTIQLAASERARLALPLFEAFWAEDRDIGDDTVLKTIADDVGFDGSALLEACSDPRVKQELIDATKRAENVGVVGAPSFLIHDAGADGRGSLYWGQDRLELVARVLDGWRPSCG